LATAATEEVLEGTITVLFTDVQGSTEMRNQRGDEAAGSILRAQGDLVRHQIEAHAGREVKALGDGFMVAFASARKAVACAVAIQKAIHENNHKNPEREVHVRIGMNSGEVSQQDGDLFGAAVNAASRVAAKAKGDQILVTGVVKQLAGKVSECDFIDRGRFRLKGFDERWQLFEVAWTATSEQEAVVRHLPERAPFVGREKELAELILSLDQVTAGNGRLVMLGGEPGVGKTRLAEEVLAEARRRGHLAVTGRCYENAGAQPYSPFIELVEESGRLIDDDTMRQALGEGGGEVARLVPALRRRFPELPPPVELPPEQERRYLYNSIREFVGRASDMQPICVLLDDLHWADEGSLLLLDRIAEDLSGLRVLLIGTYRDVELDLSRPLARTLDGLVRRHLASRLSIRRLPEADVGRMLEALGGATPPPALVGSIYAETEGNPFFVEEVFKHLAESGLIIDPEGRWRSDLNVSELEVPESVRLVVGRRLERLGENARRALSEAAIVGRLFDFRLLQLIAGDLGEDSLLDALDEAERAGLVTSAAAGDDVRYQFAHELIRQTLLTGLSALRRQRLHLRVAEAMEQVYGESPSDQAAEIARHLIEAGASADRRKAVHYLDLAGQRALSAAAFESALSSYENALAMIPPGDLEMEATIKRGLGQAYRSLGRWEECQQTWSQAIDIYESLGHAELVGSLCTEQATQLTWGLRYEEALLVAGRGLSAVGEEPSNDRALLLALSGVTLSLAGNYAAGEEMTGEALVLAKQLGEDGPLGFALGTRSIHRWAWLELRESVDLGRESLRIAQEAGQLWRQADVGPFLAMSLHFLGRDAEAIEILDLVEPPAVRIGHRQCAALCFRIRNMVEPRGTGYVDEQLHFLETDRAHTQIFSTGSWRTDNHSLTAVAQYLAGDLEAALESAERSVEGDIVWVWDMTYHAVLMLIQASLGDREAALASFAEIEGHAPAEGAGREKATIGYWAGLGICVEALILLGERSMAAAMRSLLEGLIEQGVVVLPYTHRLTRVGAALAAWADGDWDAAQAHLDRGESDAAMCRDMIQAADIKRFRSMMMLDRAEPADLEGARELLQAATAEYKLIGMPRHVAIVGEMQKAG
jgi:class 3 adenylate cyclase/tetratricopeptide (TPR) repeat protein